MRQTTLDLNGPFLSFTQNPVGLTTSNGGTVVLTGIATATFFTGVSTDSPTAPANPATGTGDISYKWYEVGVGELIDGTRISGSGTTTLTLSNLTTPIDSGRQFYLVADYVPSGYGISTSTGNAINEPTSSGIATITIDPLLEIIAQPSNRNTLVNQNTTFDINATLTNNDTNISYQWYLDGTPVNDGTITKQTASATTIAATDLYATPTNFMKADLPLNSTSSFSDTSSNSATVNNYADGGAITISSAQSKYYTASARKPIITPQSTDFRESHIDINTKAGSQFGTGDFCIEAWIYTEDFNFGNQGGMDFCYPRYRNGSPTDVAIGIVPYIRIEGNSIVYRNVYNAFNIASTGGVLSANTWHHIAITRSNSRIDIYVDGIRRASGSDSTNYTGIEYWMFASIRTFTSGFYIQNIRIFSGIARYTGGWAGGQVFTPSNEIAPFLRVALPLNSDFQFDDKTSLVTGVSNSNTVRNYADAGANITISTDQSKFYGSSARKPILTSSTTGFRESHIDVNTGAGTQIGYQDYTIEFWMYASGSFQDMDIIYPRSRNGSALDQQIGLVPYWRIASSQPGGIEFRWATTGQVIFNNYYVLPPNQWNHIALVRSNGGCYTVVNGSTVGSFGRDDINYTGYEYWFFASISNFGSATYFQDVRVYSGVAKYKPRIAVTLPGSMFTYRVSETKSFSNNGSITLPSSSTNVRLTVAGAKGGRGGDDSGSRGGSGGKGRQGVFSLPNGGRTLSFNIGKRGNDGTGCFTQGGGAGGSGESTGGRGGNQTGGGCSGTGAGGGGSTGVTDSTTGGRIVVAGGGGGGGGGAWDTGDIDAGGNGDGFVGSAGNQSANNGSAGQDAPGRDGSGNDRSGGGGGGAGTSGGNGGTYGTDKSARSTSGAGGGSGYNTNVVTLLAESENDGDGFVNISYDYITDDSTVATSLVNQNVYLSGTKTKNFTIRSDYATVQNVYCQVSSPLASNSPLTSNSVTFASLPSADSAIINIESIGNTNTANLSSVNLNNSDFEFNSFSSKPNAGVSVNYVSLYSPNRDINVEMDLYGGKGADSGSNPGGEGGFSRIRFTMERNVEYVIEGVGSNVNAPYVYRKGKLIASVGQGGSAGVSGKGGFGGGINVAGQEGTGRLLGAGGASIRPSELPSNGVFGSLTSQNPTAPDTKAIQPNAGRALPCTKGIYWQQQGVSACSDIGTTQFRLPDGTLVSNTASISRGYKAGYNIIQTAGRGIEGGNGGNGVTGGTGGQSGAGGGGGSGYYDGSVSLVSTALGGSNEDSKVILRVASSAAGIPLSTPNFEYLIIGGGGGGGSFQSGGGGAGGFLTGTVTQYIPSFTVVVGRGGAGAVGDGGLASNGGNSSIISGTALSLVALGGGRGGSYNAPGADGGSGGGGGPRDGSPFFYPGGNSLSGQGNNGGQGYAGSPPYPGGGGGGGAGAPGGNKTSSFSAAGNGGNGKESSITGTPITYAGGGGGGQYYDGNVAFVGGGLGGTGGGGTGGVQVLLTTASQRQVTSGVDGLGGGGGGGGYNQNGGNGGSGIVIIRYPVAFSPAITTGNVEYNVVGQYRIYIWRGDGSLTFV